MHTVRRRRSSVSAAVLLAAVFLAGCAGSGGSGGGEPELGPVEADPATAGLSFPMDAYTDTGAERIRMGQVQQTLVSRCMARYGFTYEPVRPVESSGGEGRRTGTGTSSVWPIPCGRRPTGTTSRPARARRPNPRPRS
ncbi:hypothetical protein WKI68_19470 [Streptomyces sp. MS1.HAVA.3]|uniref:Uncharacterized protein n=1 Tax=Streptomyces caledonius TaxID=3134107 RepID=A0ABU8U510_9ACTN